MVEPHTEPCVFDIDPSAWPTAIQSFVDWSGSQESVKVLFTPDALLAVETPSRRGYLYDEAYFVTLWSDRGCRELEDAFRARSVDLVLRGVGAEPEGSGLLRIALDRGLALDEAWELL